MCPKTYNPGDFFIQKLAIIPTRKEECLQRVNMICDKFESSPYFQTLQLELNEAGFKKNINANTGKLDRFFKYSTNSFTQIYYLLWRAMLNSKRNKVSTYVRTVNTLVSKYNA